jgi:hypothetical protein
MAAILEVSGQPRLIRAEEVAEEVMTLCSAGADEMTGELVILDGKDTP